MNSLDENSPDLVAEFMKTPLVQWIQLLLNQDSLEIEDLLDGVALNDIMLQIDPRPTNKKAHKNARSDVNLNVQNLMMLIEHIKAYFEEIGKQVIVMSLPNVMVMVKNISTPEGLSEMKKLLLLVLGCAVQCEDREQFIMKMRQLTYDGMETMMNHIKYITENTDNVLNMQWEELVEIPTEDLEDLTRKMSYHIQRLVTDRDNYSKLITDVTLERDYLRSQLGSKSNLTRRESFNSPASRQHLMVELNDLKSKLRKTKQELDEKVEINADLKQECEDTQVLLRDVRKENAELLTDARSARAMRDENDILKEKAGKAGRLEFELDMLKEKLKDVEFYKQRVEEVRDDNKILHETKDLLEEQLESTRLRLDGLVDAEKKIIDLKRQLQDMSEERDRDRLQIRELMETNSNLEMDKMQSMNESGSLAYQLERARGTMDGGRKSIQAESEESAYTRALRLEKENKRLQALVNTYKDSIKSSELTEANMLELEKENKRLSNRLQQMQEHISKEKQSVLDFEQLSDELAAERKRLETTLETSRATSERRIQEMEEDHAQLNKTIDSLRERAKIGGDAKVKAIEKENNVLSELVNDITSKLHKSDYDRKKLSEQLADAKHNMAQAESLQTENAKLEKQNVTLEKTVKHLQLALTNNEEQEQIASDLSIENRQLKKQVETLRQLTEQLQELEQDKNVTEQEATRLKRQVESLKKNCNKMSELEQDKLECDRRCTQLQQSLDAMRTSVKQKEKLEVVQVELESELERVRSQLESSKQRLNKREDEIGELERENEQGNTKLNQLMLQIKKLERFEKENQDLSSENNRLESSNKKINNEVQRLKRALESASAQLDDANDEVLSLNRQNKSLNAEVEDIRKTVSLTSGSEEGFRKLQKQQAIDKRTLTVLREELVNEKLTSQQRQSELDRLHTELEDIGINKDELLKYAQDGENDKRFEALESRLESTLQKSLSAKEDKITSLESRLQESANLNTKLRTDIKNLRRDYDALAQRHQEEVLDSNDPSGKRDSTTQEIIKMKDHLISVERKNATLLADNAALKGSSHDLQAHVKSLQSQVTSLQRQNEKIQETNESVQKQCAKLQVEKSTLQSQCGSLLSQNAQSNSNQSSVEADRARLEATLAAVNKEREQLEKDHDDMSALYERQTIELESLMQDHQKLKQSFRQVKQDQKELENKFNELHKKNSEASKQRLSETSMASGNLEVLKDAHDRLNRSYKNLNNEYEDLQSEHLTLKSSYNQLKLNFAKLEAETSDIRDHNQQLDIAASKLTNRCDVLMQLKANLEEENRHLLDQISRLMSQNEELLSQTLESKDQIYSEQKQYTERMQEIRRQKEKLEEKIMDIYRTPGHSPQKRKGFGATLRKTFQNLGSKGSDTRRRKDGLPPHGSSSNISTVSDQTNPPVKRSNSIADEAPQSTVSRQNSGSVGSSNPDLTEVPRKNSVDKEQKRRSKLGGMAYSTTAINQISVNIPHSSPAKGLASKDRDDSFSRLRKTFGASVGDISAAQAADNNSIDRSPSDRSQTDSGDISSSKEKISHQKFLAETFKNKEEISQAPTGDSPPERPIPAKRSKSPPKKQPLHTNTWATSSFRRTSSLWPDDHCDKTPMTPSIYRCPPTLDLSSLTEGNASNDKDSARSPGKSPTSAVALIKVTEKENEEGLTEEGRQNLKRDTVVYVVRSQSDAAGHKADKLSSGRLERSETSVVMRPHHYSQPRPTSMHANLSKPTSSVSPVVHTASAQSVSSSPMSAVQRLSSLVGSPRGSGNESGLATSSRDLNTINAENGNLRSKSTSGLASRRSGSDGPLPSPSYSFNQRPGSRFTSDSHLLSRELTSTPLSSRGVDVATVNPIISSSTNMIRRDVPPPDVPPSAPSPIRRDVPPDLSSYNSLSRRPRNYSNPDRSAVSSEGKSSFQKRPPTPKMDAEGEKTDKNSQWFEYGCI